MVKFQGGQRESVGVVVPLIDAEHYASGGKDPHFDHAGGGGKRKGMTGTARSNHSGGRSRPVDAAEPLLRSRSNVRKLQRKLWAAAKQSSGRRFHALFDRVYRGDVLWAAWDRVCANRGAAGVDRMTLAAVEDYGVNRMLRELGEDLRAGRYRPAPAPCMDIPKPQDRTGRSRAGQDVGLVIEDINPILRGWGNYFRTGNASKKFRQVDDWVVSRLRGLMVKKRGRNLRPGQWRRWDEEWFNGHGLYRLRGTVRYPKAA